MYNDSIELVQLQKKQLKVYFLILIPNRAWHMACEVQDPQNHLGPQAGNAENNRRVQMGSDFIRIADSH